MQIRSKAERSGTDCRKSFECQLKRGCQWQTMIPSEIIKEKLYNEGGVYVACEKHLSGKEGSECILDEQDTLLLIQGRDWELRKLLCFSQPHH